MYYLVIGSSIEPALFHAGCRPSHHVGLRPALASDLFVRKACPALTSDLLVRKAHPTLTSNHVVNYNHIRKAQHSHSPAWQDITIIYEKSLALISNLLVRKAYFHPGGNTSYSQ